MKLGRVKQSHLFFLVVLSLFVAEAKSLAMETVDALGKRAIHCANLLTSEFTDLESALRARTRPNQLTLIVNDGISSGVDYAPRARQLFPGINVVHVQTSPDLPQDMYTGFGFNPNSYDLLTLHQGDDLSLLSLANAFETVFPGRVRSVAGAETAIFVHDRLAAALELPNNDPGTSMYRRDKEWMAHGVAEFLPPDMKTIPGKTFRNAPAALAWIREQGLDFPIFAKPPSSAGSFGGTIIESYSQLEKMFSGSESLIGRIDPLGGLVDRLLIQPFRFSPTTEEFVVDAVVDPELGVVVTDLYKYRKVVREGRIAYEGGYLVRFDGNNPLHRRLVAGAKAVADGVRTIEAPLHIEFFVDGEQITFIEAAARPGGGGMPRFVRACGGNDQITMHLLALFDRKRFKELAMQGPVTETEGMQIDLQGPAIAGFIASLPSDEEIRAHIPGLINIDWHVSVGGRVESAKNLFNSPGIVNVRGSGADLERAYQMVRKLEAQSLNGLYRLRP